MEGAGPPPPPPRHGENPKTTAGGGERGGLPDGNYDIFIIPPHSAGSGFLYLPSLQNQRNCLIVGQLLGNVEAMILWMVIPAIFNWFREVIAPGGGGIVLLLVFVSGASYLLGKIQGEKSGGPGTGTGGPESKSSGPQSQPNGAGGWGSGTSHQQSTGAPPPYPDSESRQRPEAQTKWEQAREETKRKTEQQRREDDARKKKEEDEKKAKADATKRAWEAKRQAQKDEREKLEREKRLAEERAAREKKRAEERAEREKREAAAKVKKEAEERAAKEKIERELREKIEKEMADNRRSRSESPRKPTFGVGERTNPYGSDRAASSSPRKPYQFPTATSAAGTESAYSYRPYDQGASSVFSDSTYASASTARTSPPTTEFSGPFVPRNPDQIILKAVYKFTSMFPNKPVSQLRAGMDKVSNGLVLRIETEGLFIDDERRNVPQREWDIKTWTLKVVETGSKSPYVVLRAAIRDTLEGKTFVFVFAESEGWKLAKGLQKLKEGPGMRPVNTNKMTSSETKTVLTNIGLA